MYSSTSDKKFTDKVRFIVFKITYNSWTLRVHISAAHWSDIFYDRGNVEFLDSIALPLHAYDVCLIAFLLHTSGARQMITTMNHCNR